VLFNSMPAGPRERARRSDHRSTRFIRPTCARGPEPPSRYGGGGSGGDGIQNEQVEVSACRSLEFVVTHGEQSFRRQGDSKRAEAMQGLQGKRGRKAAVEGLRIPPRRATQVLQWQGDSSPLRPNPQGRPGLFCARLLPGPGARWALA